MIMTNTILYTFLLAVIFIIKKKRGTKSTII